MKIDPSIIEAAGIDPVLAYQTARHESCRLKVYPDPNSALGKAMALAIDARPRGWQQLSGEPWTIGYGHTGPEVHPGLVWLQSQADTALCADLKAGCATLAKILPWTSQLAAPRRRVLQDMAFCMGYHGLLGFPSVLAYAQRGDFEHAAWNILWTADAATPAARHATAFSLQTGHRALELYEQMRTGVQQPAGVDIAAAQAGGFALAA